MAVIVGDVEGLADEARRFGDRRSMLHRACQM
jgi:hypothetical protein